MRTFSVNSSAPPETAWSLLARPDRWPEWAPHVRGAWGLGAPEVRKGAIGAARLFGALPVPARIVAKRSGRSWTWRVGPVEMVHRVEPLHLSRPGASPPLRSGCEVAIDLIAPGPLERALAAAYGPVIAATLRRLAEVAQSSSGH
jgi:hypothetical protein